MCEVCGKREVSRRIVIYGADKEGKPQRNPRVLHDLTAFILVCEPCTPFKAVRFITHIETITTTTRRPVPDAPPAPTPAPVAKT